MTCKFKTDLAILVSEKYYKELHPDDLALKEAMNSLGYSVEITVWDNQNFDYSSCQLAIIRSCWDYDQRVDEFLQRMLEIEKQCQLFNSYRVIKKNSSKLYLSELQNREIPVVPSFFVSSLSGLDSTLPGIKTSQLVVKPVISASGRDTYRVRSDNKTAIHEAVKAILGKKKEVLIQPYQESIETLGERSTVVIDGKPVFTMLKKPAPGNFLVHQHWGGDYSKTEITEKDRFFIKNIFSKLDPLPLYARVDYIYDHNKAPLLLELELIEPNLYLSEKHPGLEMLAHRLSVIIEKDKRIEA